MLILISDAFDASLPEKLAIFGEITTDKTRLAEADVVLVRGKTKCIKEYIDSATNLKMIIRGGVGIDNIDKEYAESKNIIVKNTPKASAIAVAELTFNLMLSTPNHLIAYHNGMKEGKWLKKEIKRTELNNKTLCLVGIGHIASEVAKRALAFNMKVVSYDKYVKSSPYAEMMSLEDAVKEADYICMHTPLTPETKDMLNKDLIAKMNKKPIIINTCRALCVNADDMLQALEEDKVSWYCTDVYPSDPVDPSYPLLKSDKVTLTPHVGANTKENLLRIGDEIIETIKEYKDGGKI